MTLDPAHTRILLDGALVGMHHRRTPEEYRDLFRLLCRPALSSDLRDRLDRALQQPAKESVGPFTIRLNHVLGVELRSLGEDATDHAAVLNDPIDLRLVGEVVDHGHQDVGEGGCGACIPPLRVVGLLCRSHGRFLIVNIEGPDDSDLPSAPHSPTEAA